MELARSLGIEAALVVAGPRPVNHTMSATVEEHLNHSGCELLGVIENQVVAKKD